ncbi:DEAD-box ATP-dependent RNA helicase 36-like [Salvia splendens]|uniref:DEAD-box ATP-dependent RNA helicase 36-like n=1 Tax=Salvia splendens TaxID=180675 RepID=UPI001C26D28A|nr:DEAD-box ATP-dependent RNA helicase 36-like [Salvia splendens]
MEEEIQLEPSFQLFSRKKKKSTTKINNPPPPATATVKELEKVLNPNPTPAHVTFSDLGLAEWAVNTCKELKMKHPTPVQYHCIPKILAGRDVLGLAQTGSGKTAAFVLPILQRLAEDPYGVFALVVTPTRELAHQLADQFKALGSGLGLRCVEIVGGMDMITQSRSLMQRPHVVVATPGRIKFLLEQNPDLPAIFSRTKFLVLDEADRVMDINFEAELRVIFQCLPKKRQTLLFTATMSSNLQTLLELSANKTYFYAAYEGFKTVESLKQQYIFIPKNVRDVYLLHILNKMKEMGVRSAMIFVSTCRSCELLSLLLEQLDLEVAALHSYKSQSLRLSALHKFKSGQVPILIATDVANRGLDIPTVDLVINYDIPRYPEDYIHRVGRTARVGRGGLALSFITKNDVDLVHKIEDLIGKKFDEFECKEKDVLEDITKVYKARRVIVMKMMDSGFEEKALSRKEQKSRTKEIRRKSKKRKRGKAIEVSQDS